MGVLVENNMESFVTAPHLSAKCFFFTISGPEIDEITFPRLSSQHQSLSAPLHPQLIFFISQPCALFCRTKRSPHVSWRFPLFFFFLKSVSYPCLCLVSLLRHLCHVSSAKASRCFFYHCDISHFKGITAHANASMLLRVPALIIRATVKPEDGVRLYYYSLVAHIETKIQDRIRKCISLFQPQELFQKLRNHFSNSRPQLLSSPVKMLLNSSPHLINCRSGHPATWKLLRHVYF